MKNIKICLRIAVSILAVILWTSFDFSYPVIDVQVGKNSKDIKRQTKLYLHHLDLHEKLLIIIRFSSELPKDIKGMAISLNSPNSNNYRTFRILLDDNMSNQEQMLVLAHEMIHIKQYVKKELIILNEKIIIWKGKEYQYLREYNRNTPWEREAYQYDYNLARLVKHSQSKDRDKKVLAKLIAINSSCTSHCED